MFFACLPVAAWETVRTTNTVRRREASLNLFSLCFHFHPFHSTLVPVSLSILLVICSCFPLSVTRVVMLEQSISILFLVCSGASESLLLAVEKVSSTSFIYLLLLKWWSSVNCGVMQHVWKLCASLCERAIRPAVRVYHACLVFEFYCLSGLKRLSSYSSGMHCTYCCIYYTGQSCRSAAPCFGR